MLITHDNGRKGKFFELLENGKIEEAKAVRAELPEISGRDINAEGVQAVLQQTNINADRFVFSPFESDEISRLFKGECQNYRIRSWLDFMVPLFYQRIRSTTCHK